MNELAELTALNLENAREILAESGYKVSEQRIEPPIEGKGQGKQRVIAVRKSNNKLIELIWSYEKYF